MSIRTVSLLGGPGSGKSTYLGAVLDALLGEQTDGFTLLEQAADMTVISQLIAPLLRGEYPTRTATGQTLACELRLGYRDPTGTLPFTLSVGDYAGEEVERLFEDRVEGWSPEWRRRAGADALLVTLRPAAIVPLPRMGRQASRAPKPARPFGADPTSVYGPGLANDEIPERGPAAPDEPIRIPVATVLALIELLQFIRHARGLAPGQRPSQGRLRIGVILTAWDAVAAEWREQPPAAYLAHHVPLLVDFLRSNFLAEDVLYFGISATGGDLKDAVHRASYLEGPGGSVAWADARGTVQRRTDLALPLRWALFGDASMRHDP